MNDQLKQEVVLVTGGAGFVAGWIIVDLLKQGYPVRTSLRSLGAEDALRATFAAQGADVSRLSFCAADLLLDKGWDEAVAGCTYVIHTASPISQGGENGNDLVTPAREGTLRILRAASAAGVRRVVMTSSLNAASLPPDGPKQYWTDETRWTDVNAKGVSEYARSKTLAERAAWDFIEADTTGMTLATILPGMIIGPVMTSSAHGSVDLVARFLNGGLPMIPNLGYIMSDVRDLVDIHIKAMIAPEAANQRFAAAGDYLWLTEVADLLRERYGDRVKNIPTRKLPDFIIHLAAPFSPPMKLMQSMLGQRIEADTGKALRLLNWAPRSSAQAVIDCADSLFKMKAI